MAVLTQLKRQDFEEILKLYDFGKYKKSKHIDWALQNTLYFVTTTKGKYVLKLFEGSTMNFIRFQTRIIEHLSTKKVPVAKLLKSKRGKDIECYQKKPITIQKFIEGRPPKKFDDALTKDIAKKMGLMNKHLLELRLTGKYTWHPDYHFRPEKRRKHCKAKELRKEELRLTKEMQKLERKKLRKSIIHSDFHDINLIVKDNKLKAILDWDDAHEDYAAYDPAVFILSSYITYNGVSRRKISLFMKEYQKHLKFNEEEIKALYYFIKKRILGVIFWSAEQANIHKDHAKRLENTQMKFAKFYHNFSRISSQDFIELC